MTHTQLKAVLNALGEQIDADNNCQLVLTVADDGTLMIGYRTHSGAFEDSYYFDDTDGLAKKLEEMGIEFEEDRRR